MQQDEAAGGQVVVGVARVDDVGGERDGVRRDALRRGHLGETDLRAQAGAMEVLEGPGELGRLATCHGAAGHHVNVSRAGASRHEATPG